MVARACVAVLAVLVLAWLGVMERDARLEAEGTRLAGNLAVAGNFARADAKLRAARRFNPDTTPELKRGVVYLGAGRPGGAAAIFERIVWREPDNLAAWAGLFTAARGRDPVAADRALAARRRLDPLRAPPRR